VVAGQVTQAVVEVLERVGAIERPWIDRSQRLFAAFLTDFFAAALFAALFLVVFFAALRFRARPARASVVAAGRRRVLALVFPRLAAVTFVLLDPAFFVAMRFGVPVRLTGDLVLVLARFFATARCFEVAAGFAVADRLTGDLVLVLAGFFVTARLFVGAVGFRFDDFEADFEARLCVPVRART
jgi:hypothetical protein